MSSYCNMRADIDRKRLKADKGSQSARPCLSDFPDAMAEVQPEGNKMVKESRGGLGREFDTLKSKTQTVQLVSKY